MRKLSQAEINQVSGAGADTTFVSGVGGAIGGTVGAAVGSRFGMTTAGMALGSGAGGAAAEVAWGAMKDAAKVADTSGFRGTSFFPQTPSSN